VELQPILIADDDMKDVLLAKCQLQQANVLNPLRAVHDGDSVIEYLNGEARYADRAEHPYPILLLLDLKMPGKDGFDVLEWLRGEPDHKDLPVVVLTATDDLRQMNKAYALGAQSFLTKPICLTEFTNVLTGIKGLNLKAVQEEFLLERVDLR
jgi:CheY-like chemotaxis protein